MLLIFATNSLNTEKVIKILNLTDATTNNKELEELEKQEAQLQEKIKKSQKTNILSIPINNLQKVKDIKSQIKKNEQEKLIKNNMQEIQKTIDNKTHALQEEYRDTNRKQEEVNEYIYKLQIKKIEQDSILRGYLQQQNVYNSKLEALEKKQKTTINNESKKKIIDTFANNIYQQIKQNIPKHSIKKKNDKLQYKNLITFLLYNMLLYNNKNKNQYNDLINDIFKQITKTTIDIKYFVECKDASFIKDKATTWERNMNFIFSNLEDGYKINNIVSHTINNTTSHKGKGVNFSWSNYMEFLVECIKYPKQNKSMSGHISVQIDEYNNYALTGKDQGVKVNVKEFRGNINKLINFNYEFNNCLQEEQAEAIANINQTMEKNHENMLKIQSNINKIKNNIGELEQLKSKHEKALKNIENNMLQLEKEQNENNQHMQTFLQEQKQKSEEQAKLLQKKLQDKKTSVKNTPNTTNIAELELQLLEIKTKRQTIQNTYNSENSKKILYIVGNTERKDIYNEENSFLNAMYSFFKILLLYLGFSKNIINILDKKTMDEILLHKLFSTILLFFITQKHNITLFHIYQDERDRITNVLYSIYILFENNDTKNQSIVLMLYYSFIHIYYFFNNEKSKKNVFLEQCMLLFESMDDDNKKDIISKLEKNIMSELFTVMQNIDPNIEITNTDNIETIDVENSILKLYDCVLQNNQLSTWLECLDGISRYYNTKLTDNISSQILLLIYVLLIDNKIHRSYMQFFENIYYTIRVNNIYQKYIVTSENFILKDNNDINDIAELMDTMDEYREESPIVNNMDDKLLFRNDKYINTHDHIIYLFNENQDNFDDNIKEVKKDKKKVLKQQIDKTEKVLGIKKNTNTRYNITILIISVICFLYMIIKIEKKTTKKNKAHQVNEML